MRRKIKELMNKEEGFTLVELLAVIVILGIIVAIAVPSIGNILGDSQDKATAAETTLIEDAARLYDIEKNQGNKNDSYNITVKELQDQGYLDLRNNEKVPTGGVKVERIENGGTTYKYDSEITASTVPTT